MTQRPSIPSTRARTRAEINRILDTYSRPVKRYPFGATNVLWTLNDNWEPIPLYKNLLD